MLWTLGSGRMSSGEVQSFAGSDDVEDLKHDDIASGLPFVPISLVSASRRPRALCCSAMLEGGPESREVITSALSPCTSTWVYERRGFVAATVPAGLEALC